MLKSNHKVVVVVVVEEALFLDLFDVLDAVFQGDIFQDFISKDEKQSLLASLQLYSRTRLSITTPKNHSLKAL